MLDSLKHRRHGPHRASAPPSLRRWIRAVVALALTLVAGTDHSVAQDPSPEYQKKAQFIGKLARYVEWPKEKLGSGTPFVIGIFGNDEASDQIKEIIGGRRFKGREVIVKHCATIQEIAGCHMLFVSRSEEARLAKILGEVRGDPVLTVGECDSFITKGGIINLRSLGGEVTLELNEKNARRSSLKLDPMLAEFQRRPDAR